jgi:outer membrane protein assembly factor BamB
VAAVPGPDRHGNDGRKGLPLRWGGEKGENVAWTAPLPGEGHASPVVWGDRVVVCTVRWAGGKPDPAVIPEHHVACFAAADGKLLWDARIDPGPWRREDFRSGPGEGSRRLLPSTDGKHVYVVFGSSVMAALDLDGKLAWRQEIRPHTFDVTIGTSPVMFGDTVILLCAMAKPADSGLSPSPSPTAP